MPDDLTAVKLFFRGMIKRRGLIWVRDVLRAEKANASTSEPKREQLGAVIKTTSFAAAQDVAAARKGVCGRRQSICAIHC